MSAKSDHPTSPPSPLPGPITTGNVSGIGIAIGQGASVAVYYQGTEVAIPSPNAIAQHRIALREQLEKDARARWGALGVSTYIQEEGATLPIEASPYQAGQLGPRQNLLQTLQAADRLLVLGEPGSGKTVALERLAWELCGSAEPTVPVVIRLFQYDGKPLADWVRARLQEQGCLRLDNEQTLTAFLQEGAARCVFLFDGLNEVPPAQRNTLVGELVRWMGNYARHAVIVTSRSQDELWRQLRGEMEQAVVVQPIHDEQARAYLEAHLAHTGAELYARLDERLRALAQTPLVLWLIKEAGAAGESLPGNRGELYARFVSRMLRRDTERQMDAAISERVKRSALAELAFHLGREQKLYCSRDEAVEAAAQKLGMDQAEAVIGACIRHGLLAGEERLWFAPHQTVQEHFAARALLERVEQEQKLSGAKRLWYSLRNKTELTALAADDWWMETFVQLAGLVDAPRADWLVREVTRANAWLAWWCVEEGRGITEETRTVVAEHSVKLLDSVRVADRRRAVQTLVRIRSERAMRPLLNAAADREAEIAGIAVQALGEMGEAARALIEETLRSGDRQLRRGAIRYLVTQPDDALCQQIPWEDWLGQPMVWAPPGPFLMGSDQAKGPQAYDDELPKHEVTLPGYWIGRYPVTVAEFRRFVKESGHPADEDSLKDADDHPVRYVSWHDALAYCRWLSERTGLLVRLPSEAEWEKAARGTDGHIYPWGDQFNNNKCNTWESGIRTTTPVGKYSPVGDSPYGCADMAGNVWEWTSSKYGRYPYEAEDGREDLKGDSFRVVRGGSWDDVHVRARAADRFRGDPHYRFGNFGFRVMVRPPSP